MPFNEYDNVYSKESKERLRFVSMACTKTVSILVSCDGHIYTIGGKKDEKFGTLGREGGISSS